MPRSHPLRATHRVFALPAARLTLALISAILLISLLAGAIRVLPLLLAPGVPLTLAPTLARSIAAVSLEAALFLSPSLAWSLAASRLVDRGEARALFSSGIPPHRLVSTAWPLALALLSLSALASAAWGREAIAPGRALRALLSDARAACLASPPPAAAEVPLLGITWICLPGEAPLAVAPAPSGLGAFSATRLAISDDLASLQADDLTLVLPAAADGSDAHLHTTFASIHGLTPIGRPSNLSIPSRVLLLSLTASTLAALAALLTLLASLRSRVAAIVVGASGPAASLLVFSALERAPAPLLAYAAVPAAGLLALLAAASVSRLALAR